MQVNNININEIKPYNKNPRDISDKAIDSVAHSIKEFGWQQPIVVDKDKIIVVGHTRFLAAQKLNFSEVPVVIADQLTEEKIKAYRILDNRLNELSGWDEELLNIELKDLENADESIRELLNILEEDEINIDDSQFLDNMSENVTKEEKVKLDMEEYQSVTFVMLPEDKKMVLSTLRDIMDANGLTTSTQALLKILKEI
tara:strand:- start:15911 stop:16507 length:597 start_codon:yes stop_codon:yes gene_type:complete